MRHTTWSVNSGPRRRSSRGRGLLLMTLCAPLQTRQQQIERGKFAEALQEVTHILDLQEPVLLLGDFNGSAEPGRDFRGRGVADLLSQRGQLGECHGGFAHRLCRHSVLYFQEIT